VLPKRLRCKSLPCSSNLILRNAASILSIKALSEGTRPTRARLIHMRKRGCWQANADGPWLSGHAPEGDARESIASRGDDGEGSVEKIIAQPI
jgi:hypothetical protein